LVEVMDAIIARRLAHLQRKSSDNASRKCRGLHCLYWNCGQACYHR
jgi:hypothetical protein